MNCLSSKLKKMLMPLLALALVAPLTVATSVSARTVKKDKKDTEDKTLAPYFMVKGDASTESLPLKATRADVHISGVIAHVRVTQVYGNEGDKPIEATYVFPGSTRAAVFGMKMTIGERVIIAEINKKEEARKIYEDAKAAGKSASLLEQHRPNVFQMNVANIMPGDTIKVEMDYTELLVPSEGTYEFSYPAVVGPRFAGEVEKGNEAASAFVEQPYTKSGDKPTYEWGLDVHLSAGVPVQRVYSSSHRVETALNGTEVDVKMAEKDGGDRDFVLKYQLSGKAIQSGVLLFPGKGDKDESFFLAMVQPPEKVSKREMPKREYVFILDVSGSMRGFPLNTAKEVMRPLMRGMSKKDKFNVMFFSGGSAMLSDKSLPATKANIDKAIAMVDEMRGGGGTRILGALEKALALPTPDGYSRSFVVVTDGFVSVEPRVFELIREKLDEANLFAFGIGSSVNRHLIDGMARVGMGEPFIVMHNDDAAEKAAKFKKYIESPALTDIRVEFDGFKAYDVEPSAVPDLFAQRPVIVFGKYKGEAKGKINVRGIGGKGPYKTTLNVADYKADAKNEALKYLWARERIAQLADLNRLRKDDARIEEVTQLGLKYHLMTEYTSFVAVDHVVRNKGGEQTLVKQPLPLPKGVENTAVPQPAPAMAPMVKRKLSRRPLPKPSPTKGGFGSSGGALKGLSAGDAAPEKAEEERKPARIPTIRVVKVTGGLEARVVKRLMYRITKMIAGCTGSTVRVKLVIGKDGRVKSAAPLGGGKIPACMMAPLKRTNFPEADDETVVTMVLKW